jgi:hypothetical protein
MNDWQYTNQFFEEGKLHYTNGGSVDDCPYDYLSVDQEDEKLVQNELYRQKEWLEGFRFQYKDTLDKALIISSAV